MKSTETRGSILQGSGVGAGASFKILLGQSYLELFSFLSALNVKQFRLESTTSTNEQ